ncbi:hypothetical protein BDV18DRAFT_145649 [Aspergillus unguis]
MMYSLDMRFLKPVYDQPSGQICRFEDQCEQPRYHDTIVKEGLKYARGVVKEGDRHSSCYLYRLPIDVRFRIYKDLFKHDGSVLEVGRLRRTGVGSLAILRASHSIYHEAAIALYHSLSYRKLFLRTFGDYSAKLLTRIPKPLPCCRNRYKWTNQPCRSHRIGWHRPFGSILILLGSPKLKTALQRRWSFRRFIAALKKAGPIHVHTLTIVVNENWRISGFDETLLVEALFCGAFRFLGKLNLRGFTECERERLSDLIHDLKLPNSKVEMEKKKVQGQGFSIWICKPIPHHTLPKCIGGQDL